MGTISVSTMRIALKMSMMYLYREGIIDLNSAKAATEGAKGAGAALACRAGRNHLPVCILKAVQECPECLSSSRP